MTQEIGLHWLHLEKLEIVVYVNLNPLKEIVHIKIIPVQVSLSTGTPWSGLLLRPKDSGSMTQSKACRLGLSICYMNSCPFIYFNTKCDSNYGMGPVASI